jgi:hypothetical protein
MTIVQLGTKFSDVEKARALLPKLIKTRVVGITTARPGALVDENVRS